MCLFATTQDALIAKEDIKVYKVVKLVDGKLYTPFRNTLLSERPKVKNIIIPATSVDYIPHYVVLGEGIHAYTDYGRATSMIAHSQNLTVIEGIIPKGTHYWESKFNDDEIAAKYIDFGLKEYKENWFKRLIRKIFKV